MAAQKKSSFGELLAESIGALILGGVVGLGVGVFIVYRLLYRWTSLLDEAGGTGIVVVLILVIPTVIGAVGTALVNIHRRTTPWKRSWDKRGNLNDRNRS